MPHENDKLIDKNEQPNETIVANAQNNENEKEQQAQEEKAKVDESKAEETAEKNRIAVLEETNKRLVKALNDATLKRMLKEAKIMGDKEEWVRKINADLINDNDLIDEAKLGERLASDEYNTIKVFNGLEAKSTINSTYSSDVQIKDTPKVDAKNPIPAKSEKEQ
jgi:hypothetical protein